MEEKIPLHIQEEIIKRLPVKSLVRLRCVSQAWKCLIDSSEFIAAHSVTQPHHLLVQYQDPIDTAEKYVSILDDDTFPEQRFVHTLPLSVKLLKRSSIIGSSYGLLCFLGYYSESEDSFPNLEAAVLWNPSVRKSIVVGVPKKNKEFYKTHEAVLGFGVCPVTNDPIMVQITQIRVFRRTFVSSDHWKVEIYKMSSGNWRSLSSSNLPGNSTRVTGSQVVVDRFIYWCAMQTMIIDGRLQTHVLIMSFDMTNESFEVVNLPDSLPGQTISALTISISKIRDSLAMVELVIDNGKWVSAVWTMDNSVQKSFTRLFNVREPLSSMALTMKFRKSGEPIIVEEEDYDHTPEVSDLFFSDINSDEIYDPEICGMTDSFFVSSYMETLLLVGRSDCTSYGHESRTMIMNALERRAKIIPLLEQAIEDDICRILEVDVKLNASHID